MGHQIFLDNIARRNAMEMDAQRRPLSPLLKLLTKLSTIGVCGFGGCVILFVFLALLHAGAHALRRL